MSVLLLYVLLSNFYRSTFSIVLDMAENAFCLPACSVLCYAV